MNPDAILQSIDHGHVPPGCTVFPYRPFRALLSLAGALGLSVVFLAVVLIFAVNGSYALAGFSILPVLLGLFMAIGPLRGLMSAKSNVIVVTPEGVIRRMGSALKAWSFHHYFAQARMSSTKCEVILIDAQRREDVLVDDNSFGSGEQIHNAIRNVTGR